MNSIYIKGKLRFEHLKKAIKIVQLNITKRYKKKGCSKCDSKGYTGLNYRKKLIPCVYCVELLSTYKQWNNYIRGNKNDSITS